MIETKLIKRYYVIMKNDLYFCIDHISGGYPCFLDELNLSKEFKTKEEAETFLESDSYVSAFKETFKNVKIQCISIYREVL